MLPHGPSSNKISAKFRLSILISIERSSLYFQDSDQITSDKFKKVKVFWIDIVDSFVIFVAVLNKAFYSEILAEKNL